MATKLNDQSTPKTSRAPRRIDGMIPPGCKSISVIVPDELYHRLQTQASRSHMSLPDYLFNFFQKTHPLSTDNSLSELPDSSIRAQVGGEPE
jgi:hypothetical protein